MAFQTKVAVQLFIVSEMCFAERTFFLMQCLALGRNDNGYLLLINLLQFIGIRISGIGTSDFAWCLQNFIGLINLPGKLIPVVDLRCCFCMYDKTMFVIHHALD